MVRKQICITAELDAQLEALASAQHVSQSRVVRDALDAYVAQAQQRDDSRERALDRFLAHGRAISRDLGDDYRRLSREEAHDRRVLRGFEHPDLHPRDGCEV